MNYLTTTPTVMSSREISELCDKQHKHVRRDIENMLNDLDEDRSRFGRIYLDAYGRDQSEYLLPKDLTLTLISGYRIKLRKKIIDRWIELESTPMYAIPQTLSEALRLAADQADKITEQQCQIEEMSPKADGFDYFVGLNQEGVNLQRAMKTLDVGPNKAIRALRVAGVLYGTPVTPKQYYIDKGYFELRPVEDCGNKIRVQTFVTPKGLDWMRRKLPKIMV